MSMRRRTTNSSKTMMDLSLKNGVTESWEEISKKLPLSEFRKLFLEDTIEFYNLSNRAVVDEAGFRCIYQPTETSPGCAIGRHCSREIVIRLKNGRRAGDPYIFALLPNWMQSLGPLFLNNVQKLHDEPRYWDERGLTPLGDTYYKQILEQYCK